MRAYIPIPKLGPTTLARFRQRVDIGSKSICWPWLGTTAKTGYGTFRVGRENIRAHRIAYFIFRGLDPAKLAILHGCDNRICCNPYHLTAGTKRQNTKDMVSKKRHAFGERNGQARLTDSDVVMIKTWPGTQRQLAAKIGVSQSTISKAYSGKHWAHVNV